MDCLKNGTRWSVAFNFNGVMLFFQACNFLLMTFGAYWFYPRLIGTFVNCCYGCCHLAAWTMAVGVFGSPLGQSCVINVQPNQYEGKEIFNDSMTWKKDGQILISLGALQCILWCVQCFCCCLPLYNTPNPEGHKQLVVTAAVDDYEKKDKKDKKDKKKKKGSGDSS